MGAVTLSKANRLFWLGRYLERVYTGIKATKTIFDAETDGGEGDYAAYCRALGLPNDYENTADFIRRYYFDPTNPNSLISALGYAYDNAVVLRETLTSDTLAYVQMAVSAMELAARSDGPGVELQWVLDDIMAFRGSCEEKMPDESGRDIIKTGSSLERVDLYSRLGVEPEVCEKEFTRLFNRLYKSRLETDKEKMDLLVDAILDKTTPTPPLATLVGTLETLFPAM